MKHKTLRTLLCVILTVCFCLSAIVPASAAGLFGGDSGAATGWDQLIRGLKDRFIEKNPGTDETPAEPMDGTGEEFIRIFHLDCGRKYFSVDDIKKIINWIAENHYTHIELAFGNDGFRFLLDDMAIPGYTTFTSEQVKSAIHVGNQGYYSADATELTESEMNTIIAYANGKGIGVIPMIDVPGHTNALVTAMQQLKVSVSVFTSNENSAGYETKAFDVSTPETVEFVKAFVKKYIDYFAEKGCAYFNIAADECGYDNFSSDQYTALADMLKYFADYIDGCRMKMIMFNDGFRSNGTLLGLLKSYKDKIIVSYWTHSGYQKAETIANEGFKVINTHNKWYYVAGNEGSGWYGYKWALANMANDNTGEGNYSDCTVCDSGYKTSTGCMVAFWCDNPGATVNDSNLKTYIETLPKQNPDYFRAAEETPLPSIVIGGNNTELTVGENVIMSTSDGSLAAWSSSNPGVLTLKDNDAVEKALLSETSSVTVQAVGAGEAAITADLGNGNTISTAPIKVKTADTATERNITVTVGGTSTDTINGANYKNGTWTVENESIATISVDGVDATETDGYTQVMVSYSTLANRQSSWTKTNYYYLADDGNYYPIYAYRYKYSDYYYYYYYGYLKNSGDGNPTQIAGSWSGNDTVTAYTYDGKVTTPASTTVTFNGITAGTTYVTVGHMRYTINVIAEDLSGVTPLPIQTWITNNAIEMEAGTYTTASKYSTESYYPNWANPGISNYQYAKYVEVAANDTLNTQYGMHIEDLMPNGIFGYEYANTYWKSEHVGKTSPKQKLVVWSGRLHTAANNNVQTIAGTDYSNSGTEFYYVRYYDGKWAVSADRTYWVDVKGTNTQSTEQIVVYYMIRSEITQEVTTDVADWAKPKGTENYTTQISEDFVLLDFAVKYEDGTQFPETFPVDGKTMAYHCASGEAIGGSGATKYRKLNNFRAVDTSDYEVYMVTVTMTNDQANETLTATSAQTVGGYTYDGKEQVLWAIDQKTRDAASILNDYTSISGSSTYSGCTIGGDPYIRGVEVYRQHGALITYYVRAKANPDSLTVNYYIDGLEEPFYFYNINVDANNPEGKFKTTIALGDPWKGKLKDGDVKNIKGKTQWVSADLSTMPEIGAQYRYSTYTCTRVERVSDKVVNLYYTFDNTASFVIDFGLPITIPYTAINSELENPTINAVAFTSPKYGTVTEGADHAIIYTPTKTVDKIDNFQVTYTGTRVARDGETQGAVTYQVYIIPATNVYYEETFIKNNGWDVVSGKTENQALEKPGAKQNVYGYDPKVANQNTIIGRSMGGVYHTTLSLTDLSDTSFMFSNPLTFTFEGTGLDLISACNINTGMLYVEVIGKEKGGAYRALVDTYFRGDDTNIIGNGETVYQVPVVRKLDLPYDMYTVTIKGYLYNGAGTVVKASTNAVAEVNSFSSYMVEEDALSTLVNALAIPGLTEEDIDVIYMDENSILNPNAAVAAADRSMAAYTLDVASNAAATAEVYVDGFRVYNPLGESGKVVYNYTDENGIVTQKETYISLNDPTGEHAYNKDNEAGVVYYPVYDFIKDGAVELGGYSDKPGVYIEYDGATGLPYIATYKNQGPQNEIYLAPQSAIAFGINGYVTGNTIQVSARKVTNNAGAFTSYAAPVTANATEMYYIVKYDTSLGDEQYNYVVIKNTTDGVLALSALKISNNIKPFMNENLKNQILKDLKPNEGAGFTPQKFIVTMPTTVPENTNFAVNVIASASDVSKVTLTIKANDSNETIYDVYNDYVLKASNSIAVKRKLAKNWSFDENIFFLPEEGQTLATSYTFIFTAYDKSDPAKTITYEQVVTIQ